MRHVLNLFSYDHVLFLIALSVPYVFKDWKKVLLLISLFTLGHTVSLMLSVYGIIVVKVNIIDFLIPITILITAFFHLFTAGKSSKNESINNVMLKNLEDLKLTEIQMNGVARDFVNYTDSPVCLPL